MEPNVYDKIKEVDLRKTMEGSYIDYAMSVITDRALPDVRDGLKPVQRRILFSLHTLGVTPDKTEKKCATIVGETMGKYHPHGDSSIYGALVNMGQPWSYRKVLIDKHGNFGSEDGDSPAAMRYTEAKMSKMAQLMLDGIEKDEVDFVPNFSSEYEEPVVLPARFPNLLLNGAQGIAVGMATNIPPHNFEELIRAVKKIIENKKEEKETTINEILQIIKGPDFPTGAEVIGKKGVESYLSTGKGKFKIRAICEIVPLDKGKQRIVVKELPYNVHRSELIKKIADLAKDKKIEGISSIVDVYGKTSKEKIHIELKKDVNANIILNKLYKHTDLQITYSVNMLCLVNGEPKTLSALSMLEEFLLHQEEVVTRRTKYDLKKCEDRAHILEGLLKALDVIDEIIQIIKNSNDTDEAKSKLIEKFLFSDIQAQSIVDMRLKALTNLESIKLKTEYDELKKNIAYYREILGSKKKLLTVIDDEMGQIVDKEKDTRSTGFIEEEGEDFQVEDLVEEANIIISVTHLGYIKRMDFNTFKTQNRGGKGIKGTTTISEDFVKNVFTTTLHSTLLFITNYGKIYAIKGYDIPEASRTSRGVAIVNILKIDGGEKIAAIVDCKNFTENKNIIMATKNGIIKKIKLNEFNNVRKSGIKAITIKDNDELITAKITSGNDDIFLITKNGLCSRFNEDKLRNMGRTASGIKGIKIQKDDELIAVLPTSEGKDLFIMTESGIGKRTDSNEFTNKNRGGKGQICYKPDDKTGKLIGVELVNGDEDIMAINDKGLVIRIPVTEIKIIGRMGKGVYIMRNEEDTKVVSITKILEE